MPNPPVPSADSPEDQQAEHDASFIRGVGLATEIINDATAILNFATLAVNTRFNEERAENIYAVQLANLREQQGMATADAYARATLNAARRLTQGQRSAEELVAAKLLLERMQRDVSAREADKKKAELDAKKKRKAMVGYAVAGAAVLALVVTVVVMSRKPATQEPRASGSTRPRRRR